MYLVLHVHGSIIYYTRGFIFSVWIITWSDLPPPLNWINLHMIHDPWNTHTHTLYRCVLIYVSAAKTCIKWLFLQARRMHITNFCQKAEQLSSPLHVLILKISLDRPRISALVFSNKILSDYYYNTVFRVVSSSLLSVIIRRVRPFWKSFSLRFYSG